MNKKIVCVGLNKSEQYVETCDLHKLNNSNDEVVIIDAFDDGLTAAASARLFIKSTIQNMATVMMMAPLLKKRFFWYCRFRGGNTGDIIAAAAQQPQIV